MAGNIFGHTFTLTSFGESHGLAIGGVVDGCPAGLKIDKQFIQHELDRRRPGNTVGGTTRTEPDEIEILSGIFKGLSTGTPIAFLIRNKDSKSADYEHLKNVLRPSHADYTYEKKYGIRDHRGGGRASARETAVRVAGGAIAKLLLKKYKISISAYVNQIGNIILEKEYPSLDLNKVETSPVRCPDDPTSKQMLEYIDKVKNEGDTLGGAITCVIKNVPPGFGEPVFDKLEAQLAKAMLSINAVKGFEIGSGFNAIQMRGSEHNDIFVNKSGQVSTLTNYSGGIQGGISNGQDIWFKVAFKPVATLMQDQNSLNTSGNNIVIEPKGRHDVCVVPRAVPIVENMTALVFADMYLRNINSFLKKTKI